MIVGTQAIKTEFNRCLINLSDRRSLSMKTLTNYKGPSRF